MECYTALLPLGLCKIFNANMRTACLCNSEVETLVSATINKATDHTGGYIACLY